MTMDISEFYGLAILIAIAFAFFIEMVIRFSSKKEKTGKGHQNTQLKVYRLSFWFSIALVEVFSFKPYDSNLNEWLVHIAFTILVFYLFVESLYWYLSKRNEKKLIERSDSYL